MDIVCIIKQKYLIKKPLDINTLLAKTHLKHGIRYDSLITKVNQQGKFNWLFSDTSVTSGFEVWINNNSVYVGISLPNCPSDIYEYYHFIKLVCEQLKVTTFIRNNIKTSINKIDEYILQDSKQSDNLLKQYLNKIYFDITDSYLICGAYYPIYLGKKELEYIDGNSELLAQLLHNLQTLDMYYSEITFYKREINNTYFALYPIYENMKLVVPYTPIKNKKVSDYYAALPNAIIPYNKFIDNIDTSVRYDEKNCIVELTWQKINELSQYSIDTNTNKYKPCLPYYSHIIIDKGQWHCDKVKNKQLNTDYLNGYNHIATFIMWAYSCNMLTDLFVENVKSLQDLSIDLRQELDTNKFLNKALLLGHFKPQYHDFILKFYDFKSTSDFRYPLCIDQVTLDFLGSKQYHNPDYKNEAYLFMDYNQENVIKIFNYCDQAYLKYQQGYYNKD